MKSESLHRGSKADYDKNYKEIFKKKYQIFTFCEYHKHSNGYVKAYGSYDEARQKMFDVYGEKWGFQYENESDAGVEKFGLYLVGEL